MLHSAFKSFTCFRMGIKSEDVYGQNCPGDEGFGSSSDAFPTSGGMMSPDSMIDSSAANPPMHMPPASGITVFLMLISHFSLSTHYCRCLCLAASGNFG